MSDQPDAVGNVGVAAVVNEGTGTTPHLPSDRGHGIGRPYEFRELLVPSREDCEALLATITDALRSAGSGFGYAMEAVEELRSILAVDE